MKLCQNPDCNKEFEGRANQEYCCSGCRVLVNTRKCIERQRVRRNTPVEGLLPKWKADWIMTNHEVRTVEAIAAYLKETVPAIVNFCKINNLSYKKAPSKKTSRVFIQSREDKVEPEKKPFVRPPAVYDNHKKEFQYYIPRLTVNS